MKRIVLVVFLVFLLSESTEAVEDCCNLNSPGNDFACGPHDNDQDRYGNCTWYARYRRPEVDGICTGNAAHWYNQAQNGGLPVGKFPVVRSIAVFNWWTLVNGVNRNLGHVAYVERVNSDYSFYVSEMGWNTWPCVHNNTYTNKSLDGLIGFILPSNIQPIYLLLLSDSKPMNGVFYNIDELAGGTLECDLRIEENNVYGYMNFTEMPRDPNPLCGAGNLNAQLINGKVTGKFISHDTNDGCWFDDGGVFDISGDVSNAGHFSGDYEVTNANGSNFREASGVFEAWSNNKPPLVSYVGTFTNTTVNQSGTIVINISTGSKTVAGNINYTNLPGAANPICGAGEFTGIRNGDGTIEFSFISHDQDARCGFDHGIRLIQNATFIGNSINGTYRSSSGFTHGFFNVNRVE